MIQDQTHFLLQTPNTDCKDSSVVSPTQQQCVLSARRIRGNPTQLPVLTHCLKKCSLLASSKCERDTELRNFHWFTSKNAHEVVGFFFPHLDSISSYCASQPSAAGLCWALLTKCWPRKWQKPIESHCTLTSVTLVAASAVLRVALKRASTGVYIYTYTWKNSIEWKKMAIFFSFFLLFKMEISSNNARQLFIARQSPQKQHLVFVCRNSITQYVVQRRPAVPVPLNSAVGNVD